MTSQPGLHILEVAMELALPMPVLDRLGETHGPQAAQAAAMSTSVGGIGPLLRERIMAQADLGASVIGVTLLYETVWAQGWHAWNHLYLRRDPVGENLRSVLEDTGLSFHLTLFDGESVPVKVWRAAYGSTWGYFLDCPEVANVVYPCGEDAPPLTANPNGWADRQRMRQGWLVGRGALQLAKLLNFKPDIIVQSETPTLFAQPRLFQDEFQKDPFFAKSRCVFNDHTPLEYAHPVWPKATLNWVHAEPTAYTPHLHGGGEPVADVTRLLIAEADSVFGVAKKHAVVMRAMPSLRDYAAKIDSVTNGVHPDLWQAPEFRSVDSLSDQELLARKDALKHDFIDWLWRRASLWPEWTQQARGHPVLLWTRRITSYKRLDILHTLFNDPLLRRRFLDTGVILVVGGRVYQRDNVSEKMLYTLLEHLNLDKDLADRVIFISNYNVWEAPRMFQGADGAVMLSDDGREASATGFMKSQLNGGVVVANPDGAVPEFVFSSGGSPLTPVNGFGVTYRQGQPDPESFISALESLAAVFRNPAERCAYMRAAFSVSPQVSVRRTAREMLAFFEKTPPRK